MLGQGVGYLEHQKQTLQGLCGKKRQKLTSEIRLLSALRMASRDEFLRTQQWVGPRCHLDNRVQRLKVRGQMSSSRPCLLCLPDPAPWANYLTSHASIFSSAKWENSTTTSRGDVEMTK